MATPVYPLMVNATLPVKIVFGDVSGNPLAITVTPDAPPVWGSSDVNVFTVQAAADGLTAIITPVTGGLQAKLTVGCAIGTKPFRNAAFISVIAVGDISIMPA